jgi:hypothetical protein
MREYFLETIPSFTSHDYDIIFVPRSNLTSESSTGSQIWIRIRILDTNPDSNPGLGVTAKKRKRLSLKIKWHTFTGPPERDRSVRWFFALWIFSRVI